MFQMLLFSSLLYSGTIDPIINSLKKCIIVEYKRTGYSGELSTTYKTFETLKLLATNEQLVELVEHENSVVSCYAGWALIDKKYSNLYSLLEYYALKNTTVKVMEGCLLKRESLLSLFYYRYRNSLNNYEKDKLLEKFDSFILNMDDPDSLILNDVLNHRVYTSKKDIKRIQFLAFDKKDINATFYLIKWHKSEFAGPLKDQLIELLNDEYISNTNNHLYYQVILELLDYCGHDRNIKNIIIKSLRNNSAWKSDIRSFMFLLDQHNISVFKILPYEEVYQLLGK